ncbi:MAG: 50S ribosomal protein L21 [Gammaproteobacteria bacterium]|nr:50S ribosomal protein L21 [Gammaproteobacteria bacterium]
MFAVISTGGKQYCVSEGQRVRVERLSAEVGDELSFDAMLIGGQESSETRIGTSGKPVGQVRATVCEHGRAKKIEVIKFKRRKDYRRTLGHRQQFTTVEIAGIDLTKAPTKKAPAEKAPAKKAAEKKAPAKKTAAKKAPAKKSAADKAGEES